MPQPSTTGMVIPKASELSLPQMKTLFQTLGQDFEKTFDKQTKKELNTRKAELEQQELQVKYQKKIENILKPPAGFKKIQMKLAKYYDKWFIKNDFLKKVGGFFKKLIDRAGGWLKTLLEVLLFFAIFDPSGSFLTGIFNLITDILVKAINFIIPKIPVIAKRMWKLFWDVVVPGFRKLGQSIGEALFGKGALADFMGDLGALIPIIVAVAGAISYLIPIIEGIMFVVGAIGATATAVIAVVVIAVAMIWVFRDKIAEFFEKTIPKWFSGLGNTMKAIVGFIIIITAPLWGLIYGIAKLFQSFKKIGVKATMSLIWEGIKAAFVKAGRYLSKLPHKISWYIKSQLARFGNYLYKKIASVGDWLASLPGRIWESFKSSMSSLGSGIMQGAKEMIPKWLKDAIYAVKDFLGGIYDWVKAFMIDPWEFIRSKDGQKEEMKMAVQIEKELAVKVPGSVTVAAVGAEDAARFKQGMSGDQIYKILEEIRDKRDLTQHTIATRQIATEKAAKVFEITQRK